jgi:pimeloyl-ACP methyl ester carboxylesterase
VGKVDQAVYERELMAVIRQSASRLGSCDPLWLKEERLPAFQVIEDAAAQSDSAKPEMVLLHGLFGALSNWDSTFPLFSAFSRPTALQFPIVSGHRSEVRVKPLAAYTELFVRHRKMTPVALCGNSLGGHVAMRLCLTSPELVDCLILSGTSGLYEHSVDALPVRPDQRFVREHMSRVFFNQKFVTEEAINEIHQILKNRTNVLNLIHAARSAKVPTLLLWGEDDPVTTMDVARQFNSLIPNSELVSIKNCGHAPMIEHPEWFSEHVQRFLKKHSRYHRNPGK